jgi:K+-sensing histidine kinase KdpD
LDHEEGNIILAKKTLIDLHKKMLGSCAKILSYVSDSLNFCQVNVKKIIEEAIEMAHYDADINQVELIADIQEKIVDIYADERSIKHVIIALINYAMEDRKRDSENSFVKITAKTKKQEDHQFLQLIFEDNGHGISEQIRMNFKQTAQKEGKNENNISLSLQAIRSILASHQSTLQIKNIAGQGSTMVVEIPYNLTQDALKNNQDKSNIIELFPNHKKT